MNTISCLPIDLYENIQKCYHNSKEIFPLIAAVLLQQQKGKVYWNGQHNNYFIIHDFGFCQLFETEPNSAFDKSFMSFLSTRSFHVPKLRWYAVNPHWKTLISQEFKEDLALVERVQLRYDLKEKLAESSTNDSITLRVLDETNFDEVEKAFALNLAERFWPSKNSFLTNALGVIAYSQENKPVGVCYSCAIANNLAEIDIFTDPNYRQDGVGNKMLGRFIILCNEKGIEPHWDCYSNNLASLNLALKQGFKPYNHYLHAIISK